MATGSAHRQTLPPHLDWETCNRARLARAQQQQPATPGGIFLERPAAGQPHAGKVLLAVQAHSDDIPLFAAGTVAKLIDEGYTACLIRFSNDEAAGRTLGYGVVQNELDNQNAARALGCVT